jgi:pyridoxal phosphate enzyme (YggS family)
MSTGGEHWRRQLRENVQRVRQRIVQAATRCGRPSDAITLVAVTKYVPASIARALVAEGLVDLGESRPQELWQKADALADLPVRWHLVGHLQTNKVRRTLPKAQWIHSVDRQRLLTALDEEAAGLPRPVAVLLEVNLSGEPAKHGWPPEAMEEAIGIAAGCSHLQVRGLMTMAPLEGGLTAARRTFAALRKLRDRLQSLCPPSMALTELSMGMSHDLEVAIEEGATMVRVGSALFEGIELPA